METTFHIIKHLKKKGSYYPTNYRKTLRDNFLNNILKTLRGYEGPKVNSTIYKHRSHSAVMTHIRDNKYGVQLINKYNLKTLHRARFKNDYFI